MGPGLPLYRHRGSRGRGDGNPTSRVREILRSDESVRNESFPTVILSVHLHTVPSLCNLRWLRSLSVSFNRNLQFKLHHRGVALLEKAIPDCFVASMRSRDFKLLTRCGTGVFFVLVVQGLCAPGSVWAGCNHLVTSRTDPGRLPSLIEPLVNERAASNKPSRAPAQPCTGAWCSGQPATPSVPAGVFDWGLESWALWISRPAPKCTSSAFTVPGTLLLHPLHCGMAVFHPPRLLPSA